ncbi:hypothetical protein ARALYDRAFT_903774 [Arabidopsis lyrata subsp. lyrata]|uniref:Jacalin-type lectin domain-containing protein n=1 Tax=Arabidopsis lyrata subsp. lyrata TaxID=81972 RepID=D7LKH7_ARALL|nr:hypothetical protein ARALYDRAFT_903774 [Arabidopsis lyrata subsp. lyrata]
MIPVGPIGSKSTRGYKWDEKGHNMISYIYVEHDDDRNIITSIQFVYFHKKAPIMSKKHGCYVQGEKFLMIRLNHDEYVTGLSGIDWEGGVTSLTFYTNQRKHGPICKRFDYLKDRKREINVGIRDRREFGGFFGSFSTIIGCLSSIGIYVCPITSINDAVRTKYKVTEVTNADDDQLTLYQSSDPLALINHNRTLEYQIPHEASDGFHVKPIIHKPKFKDELSLYQSSDLLARSTNNRTLEYQNLEFLDVFHRVKPIGGKRKLKESILSKLGRLLKNLLD